MLQLPGYTSLVVVTFSSLVPSMDMECERDTSECPVCGLNIALNCANEHIDECLQGKHSGKKLPGPSAGNLGIERKRQSLLNFGSHSSGKLKKMKMDKNSMDSSSTHHLEQAPTPNTRSAENVLMAPLADRVRPTTIEEFVGQDDVIGKNSFLRTILETGAVPSLIFWGPPGCGKTTLAKLIANAASKRVGTKFVQLSATTSGIADVKEAVKVAKNHKLLLKKNTLLFIDEIHRFNKLQQDSFLTHVENGTITLLGATTENPSFRLNSALLSRCRVVVLEKLKSANVLEVLKRAMSTLNSCVLAEKEQQLSHSDKDMVWIQPEALDALANLSDGDARIALNGLQLAIQTKRAKMEKKDETKILEDEHSHSDSKKGIVADNTAAAVSIVTLQDIKSCLQKTHLLYDRVGDEHYHIISALHKSMRGSDANAALYWLARMLCAGEDPLYVARRVIRFASEDVGTKTVHERSCLLDTEIHDLQSLKYICCSI